MSVPNLTYTLSHSVQTSSHTPETETFNGMPDKCLKFSYVSPFNTLSVSFTSDISLSYHEARITKVGDPYGIGIGTRLYYIGPNIASNSTEGYNLVFTSENLPDDGEYLLGFYSKNEMSDGLWDVTYLYLSSEGYVVEPTDYEGIEVLTSQAIPSN